MNVLVVGGTGFVGTALCQELRDRGHTVAALSRNPGGRGLPSGVEKIVGDVSAYDSIESAFEGRDVVVNLVALSPLFKPSGGDQRHFDVHLGGTKNVVKAAKAHDVPKILQMSGIGASPDAPTSYLRAKGQAEEVVTESGLAYVIFRPAVIFGDGDEFRSFTKLVTTPYVTGLPGGGDTEFQLIHIDDFTPMMADAIEDEAHDDQAYEIAGPKTQTLAELTKLIYRSEGKSTAILPIPMPVTKLGLTVLGAVGGPLGADQARSLELELLVEDNDIDAFGVSEDDLLTYEQYLGLASGPEESVGHDPEAEPEPESGGGDGISGT